MTSNGIHIYKSKKKSARSGILLRTISNVLP